MVISHKNRYVFLELPFTATRAISQELRENYDGHKILRKHSNYPEFAKYASEVEKGYKVFCGIRNPLQIPVSLYLKYRNTRIDNLWLADRASRSRWNPVANFYDWTTKKKVEFAQKPGCTFDDYFLQCFRWPYDNWSRVSIPHCDFVLRFETLQEDFTRVLDNLGLRQVRELPRRGNAVSWSHDPAGYYGETSRVRAKWVFGPYMKRWQYEFPKEWGDVPNSSSVEVLDKVIAAARIPYWKWIRGMIDLDLHRAANRWVHDTRVA